MRDRPTHHNKNIGVVSRQRSSMRDERDQCRHPHFKLPVSIAIPVHVYSSTLSIVHVLVYCNIAIMHYCNNAIPVHVYPGEEWRPAQTNLEAERLYLFEAHKLVGE